MSGEGTHFLDTSALIALMKRGLVAEPGALISSFALAELATGIALSSDTQRERARVNKVIGPADLVLPTLTTSLIYARIAADLERKGQRIPPNDLWIAALALERKLPLYAVDNHFQRIEELNLYPCATPREALHTVLLNSSSANLLVRSGALEPTITRVKEVLRRRERKAGTTEGVPLNDGGIRLGGLSTQPGRRSYGIWVEDALTIACMACWDAAESQRMWDGAENFFFAFEGISRRANFRLDVGYRSEDAPLVPWYSCVLIPSLGVGPTSEQVRAASEYALAVVWATMDLERENVSGTGD